MKIVQNKLPNNKLCIELTRDHCYTLRDDLSSLIPLMHVDTLLINNLRFEEMECVLSQLMNKCHIETLIIRTLSLECLARLCLFMKQLLSPKAHICFDGFSNDYLYIWQYCMSLLAAHAFSIIFINVPASSFHQLLVMFGRMQSTNLNFKFTDYAQSMQYLKFQQKRHQQAMAFFAHTGHVYTHQHPATPSLLPTLTLADHVRLHNTFTDAILLAHFYEWMIIITNHLAKAEPWSELKVSLSVQQTRKIFMRETNRLISHLVEIGILDVRFSATSKLCEMQNDHTMLAFSKATTATLCEIFGPTLMRKTLLGVRFSQTTTQHGELLQAAVTSPPNSEPGPSSLENLNIFFKHKADESIVPFFLMPPLPNPLSTQRKRPSDAELLRKLDLRELTNSKQPGSIK